MDHRVDNVYKKKHFPTNAKTATQSIISTTTTAPEPSQPTTQSTKELIESFALLTIESPPPLIEGSPAPTCPLSSLPQEILSQILQELAITDLASFVDMALVCKRFAYLVATEESIWKRMVQGSEIGFAAMHYRWNCEITGEALHEGETSDTGEDNFQSSDDCDAKLPQTKPTDDQIERLLLERVYDSKYIHMLHHRPRIRFNGVYISTVHYHRPGQASASQLTWTNPVHIVTYYRYLRFYRDGSVISLLTTAQPIEVVPNLTKANLPLPSESDNAHTHLPSTVMSHALRGRWHMRSLAASLDDSQIPTLDITQANLDLRTLEGDIVIETEGVGPRDRHMYRMDLSLRSMARSSSKNTKLVWRAYTNYDRLTDDWADFTLRNDKAFVWSRVKSYGVGG